MNLKQKIFVMVLIFLLALPSFGLYMSIVAEVPFYIGYVVASLTLLLAFLLIKLIEFLADVYDKLGK